MVPDQASGSLRLPGTLGHDEPCLATTAMEMTFLAQELQVGPEAWSE